MTPPLTSSTVAYETRYRWTTKHLLQVLVSCLPAVLVWLLDLPIGFDLALVLVSVLSVVTQVLVASSGKVALRVDDAGVLLGGSPLRYEMFTALVPWEDIVAVELWVQRVGLWRKHYYVGVHRVPGARVLPGYSTGRVARGSARMTGKTPELLSASRAAIAWSLDGRVFLEAVRQLAPQVEIRVDPRFRL